MSRNHSSMGSPVRLYNMPSVRMWRGPGSLYALLLIFWSEKGGQRKLEMRMLLCYFVANGQARPQVGHPVMLHELQGDKNQLSRCNRPKKDQSYTKLRSIMLVSVSPVCIMVIRRWFVLRHSQLHLIAGTTEITRIAPVINMTLTKTQFNMKPWKYAIFFTTEEPYLSMT